MHVAVNRVSTKDGRAVNLRQCGRVLSAWAEQYERDHGKIQVPNRVARRQAVAEGRKPPPMQRPRTGPRRSPRLPAERRGWSRHYQRQRAAAETARQAGRKPDPAVERRRRVRRARRQRMIRPVRVGIAAGQTAVIALGRTAARRARTIAIATTRRIQSVAATITPRPRTDAERNERANQRALAHVNQDRPPGVLHHIVSPVMAAGAAAVTAVARGAAARSVLTPTPAAPPRPDRLELDAEMKSHGLPSPAERSAKWTPPPAAAAPRATSASSPLHLDQLLDQHETPLNINCARAAQAIIDLVPPGRMSMMVDETDLSAAFVKLIDTLPKDRSQLPNSLVRRHGMTAGAPSAAKWVIETLKFEAPDEYAVFAPERIAKFVSEMEERRAAEKHEKQQRADKAKARTAARSTSPSTSAPAPSPVQPPPSATPPSRRPAVREREPEPAPSATPEQQQRFRKLKGLSNGDGRAWYYKSLDKVARGVRPGEETSEQVGQALELAFEHFRPRPRPGPAREPDPPRPARPQVQDRGRGRDF